MRSSRAGREEARRRRSASLTAAYRRVSRYALLCPTPFVVVVVVVIVVISKLRRLRQQIKWTKAGKATPNPNLWLLLMVKDEQQGDISLYIMFGTLVSSTKSSRVSVPS
jgi:hypothetical protein